MNLRLVTTHLFSLALLCFSIVANAVPNSMTFQTKIYRPDGTALDNAAVNFRFTTIDPTGTCILYVEDFTNLNMNNSAGLVIFNLGNGTKVYPAGAFSYPVVYDNLQANFTCQGGGTYSPNVARTDSRKIILQFNDGSGSGWQTLPAVDITSVPFANYAGDSQKFGGLDVTSFLRYSALPTCAPSAVLTYDGTTLSCVVPAGAVSSVSGTAPIVSSGGANPTISINDATAASKGAVQIGTGLAVAAGAISVNYGTIAGTAAAGNDARLTGAMQTGAAAGGDLTGLYPNPTLNTVAATKGGTGQSVYVIGDLLYAATTTSLSRLAASNLGYVLTSNGPGVAPSWQAVAGGTVTNVTSTNADISVATGNSTPALTLNSGTGINQIVKLDGVAKLPAVDGSQLTGLTAAQIPALDAAKVATGVFPIARGGMNNGALPVTAGGVIYTDGSKLMNVGVGITGQVLSSNAAGAPTWINASTGTVTSASVVSANGFSGSVATATSTPAITIITTVTGLLQGNGSAISAAASGIDYSAGTSLLGTGIIKSTTGTGALSIATAGDFPALNQNTTGTASNVTGVVSIANGGTGTTTANGALNNLLPSQAANVNKFLQTDGTNTAWVAGNSGTVTNITAGTGLTGGAITTSGTIGLGTELTGLNNLATTGFMKRTGAGAYSTATSISLATDVTGTLPVANGGTGATAVGNNLVFAGPTSGGPLAPSFRALSASDIPNLSATYLPLAGGTMTGALVNNTNSVATAIAVTQAGTGYAATFMGGNVGVGTATPGYKVDVAGDVNVTGNFRVNGTIIGGGAGSVTSVQVALPAEFSVAGGPITTAGTITGSWASQTANKIFVSPDSASGSPSFRVMVANDIPVLDTGKITTGVFPIARGGTNNGALPVTAGGVVYTDGSKFMNVGVGITGQVLSSNAAGAPTWINASTGTVTSVSSANSDIGVSMASPTPVLTLNSGTGINQIVKLDGAAKLPAVDGSALTNLNASALASGAVPVARGGTGATTFANYSVVGVNGAGNQVAVPGSTSNTMLQWQVTGPAWSSAVFPSSTTANQLLYSSATNVVGGLSTANNSVLTTDGSGVPSFVASLPVIKGGTGQTTYAVGDILYGSVGNTLLKLPASLSGYVLTTNGPGTAPSWQAPATSGTVTSASVVTANGFSGTVGTPSTTPAITINTTVTGLLKGNGSAISAATAGTDYSAGTSALATGILKSTTATGVLSIAAPADFPILNQNTSGNAATATLATNVTTNANLTGDVTSVGNATTLTNAPVIAKVLTGFTSGAGTVAATDSILQAFQKLDGNIAGKQAAGSYITSLTGDVTATGPGVVGATIGANRVTNSMLVQVATQTFLGRTTAATGNVETLTATQATALLDNFTATTKGLVPSSGGGASNFLRADGTWATPSGAGDMVLASPQTVTGAKTFGSPGAVGKLIIAGSTSGQTILDATAAAGAGTVILPTSGTLLTTTGSAAGLTSFPILNQNTTGNAATVTTNANLTGDVTSVGNTTTLTNAPVIAKVLTGFTSGAGTVAATDTILLAFQKLDGNIATKGSGDMLLGSVQTVTGAKTFGSPGAVGKLIVAGSTSGQTILDATAVAGSGTVILPTSGTLLTTTGSAAGLTGFPILNQNTTGTASNVTGIVAIANGGTGTATVANNLVFAGPASGGPLAPSFRSLAASDIPSLAYLPLTGGALSGNLDIQSTNTATSGFVFGAKITPTYNQVAATTANTDLLINRTQTAIGSGQQNLIDAQVGGVSKFRVDNTGKVFGDGSGLTGVSATTIPLSGITAATSSPAAIDNLNFAQTWNWSSATTQSPLSISGNALTTGSLLNLTTSSGSINSTNGLLNVANTSATTTGTIARIQSNSTAGSGLTVLANGNVGIGTASPNTAMDINGAISQRSIASPALAPAGQGRIYFDSTSNTFKVSQNASAYSDLATAATLGAGYVAKTGDTMTGSLINNSSSASSALAITQAGTGPAATFMGGSVGIGTATPGFPLQIIKADTHSIVETVNSSSTIDRYPGFNAKNFAGTFGGRPKLSLYNSRGTQAAPAVLNSGDPLGVIEFGGADDTSGGYSDGAQIGAYAEENFSAGTIGGSNLQFATASLGSVWSTEKMRITANGNVGIGTSNPAAKLQVGAAPAAVSTYPLFALGTAPFDGGSAGFFTGNVNGTVIGINAASGYTGDLVNYQIAGVSKFKIDAGGNVTNTGTTTTSGNTTSTGNYSTTGNISTTGVGTITSAGVLAAGSGLASTSPTTGSLIVTGGAGINGALNVGNNIVSNGNISTAASAAATAGANQSSPNMYLTANYWNGSASAVDQWSIQNILGTGANPTSTMQFGHSGSSGAAQYAFMNGNVGIGTNTPTGVLDILALSTANSGTINGEVLTTAAGNSTASTATINGLNNATYYSGTANSTGSLNGINNVAMNSGFGSISYLTATASKATALSSNVTDLKGAYSSSRNSNSLVTDSYGTYSYSITTPGGTTTNSYGSYNEANNNGANVTTLYGSYNKTTNSGPVTTSYASFNRVAASGTLNTGYGGYFDILSSSTTTGYGVYIGNIQATNKYSLYASDATAPSYFAGNVGIGNTAPAKLLHVGSASVGTGLAVANFQNVDGTCTITPASSGSGIACSSDERLKENFQDVTGAFALDRILQLQAVTYNFKTSSTDNRRTGYKAQEVQKIAPEFVRQNEDGLLQVYYDAFIPWITEAIKSLHNRITGVENHQASQDQKIDSQARQIASKADKTEVNQLKSENERLKAKVLKAEQENAAIKAYLCSKDKKAPICK